MDDNDRNHYVTPDQLRIGLYIHLDLSWLDHPFKFNNFRITSKDEIERIRELDLGKIRYDPLRSHVRPSPDTAQGVSPEVGTNPEQAAAPFDEASDDRKDIEEIGKNDRSERLKALHLAIHECERRFVDATRAVKRIEREVRTAPARCAEAAHSLVNGMVDSLLTEGEVVLHAMQPQTGGSEHYVHALNVTVLALILAKTLDILAEDARQLGLGSLFHDIGKTQIPDRVLLKSDPLTTSEAALLRQHPELGARLAIEMGLPDPVISTILQHHEWSDGTGYPAKLKHEQITALARVLVIVNMYENLCNPTNLADAMTPYEALAHMFARQRRKLDADILMLFIKTLGIYPPGSIVELSDGGYGTVISVNPNKPLRPQVLTHAPKMPRETPLVVNLGNTANLTITRCLRPIQLPRAVFDYLAPPRRICYFFRPDTPECEP